MPLTWVQIRSRAQRFADDWATETYERGEAQSFYNEFFEVFGVKRRSVARFEQHVRRLDNTSGFIDLFWPGILLAEHKSYGRSLAEAAEEAAEYFDALEESQKPRFQLVCDFQSFELLDRDTSRHVRFQLASLPQYVEHFAFVLGREQPRYIVREPVNRKASLLVGGLHSSLLNAGYPPGSIDRFLVRVVFCLFADSTGIFQPRGVFHDLLDARSADDGSDLGRLLAELFQVLDLHPRYRQVHLDEDLAQFPYINGDLFRDVLPIASCDESIRSRLLEASRFDWSQISPAIFGSLFEAVLDPEERRELGGHFTSEANILRVLESLFLSELRESLAAARRASGREALELHRFLTSLASTTLFDPACGCGNFLAVAYREIRRLEIDALEALAQVEQLDVESEALSRIDVDSCHGIERHGYSIRIAETSLWMTDHLLNTDLSVRLGTSYQRVPLAKRPRLREGDALTLPWADGAPSNGFTYLVGNPPYKGAKQQSPDERAAVRSIAGLGGEGGTLDLVAAWLIKAAESLAQGGRAGFVTTSSISQGEQVAQLWPILRGRLGTEIIFAHQAFSWRTENPNRPQVYVVILGLSNARNAPQDRWLYESAEGTPATSGKLCRAISPYLIQGDRLSSPNLVVGEASRPLNGMPLLVTGTKPIDGGYFIFSPAERDAMVEDSPELLDLLRPFVGGDEFLNGTTRYLMYLPDSTPPNLLRNPFVQRSIRKVRDYRRGRVPRRDGGAALRSPNALAETPRRFHITVIPNEPFLVIPEVSSERREYVPIAWLRPPAVPSNLVKVLMRATLTHFALLTSTMHMTWLRRIGGRLENRYRYSIGLVYNTFPVPAEPLDAEVERLAQSVLDARERYADRSLVQLYDPDSMPDLLRTAHKRLDVAVERRYRDRPFQSEEDRLEHLLDRYSRLAI